MKRAWWCPVVLLLSVLSLLVLPPIPAVDSGSPGLSTTPDSTRAALDHTIAVPNPIEVALDMPSAPILGVPVEMRAVLTARWVDLPDVKVHLIAPHEVQLQSSGEVQVALRRDQPVTLTFRLQAMKEGTHVIRLEASAEHGMGTLGGYGQGHMVVTPRGPGAFHRDHLPVSPYAAEAVYIGPSSPALAPVVVPAAGPEEPALPRTTPEPYVGPTRPLSPDRPSGETGLNGAPGAAQSIIIDAGSTFVVKACWFYVDEAGGFQRQRWATVWVWDDDSPFGRTLLWTGITGEDGCFTSGEIPRAESDCCFRGNQDVYIEFVASNGWTVVQRPGLFPATFSGVTPVQTVGSEDIMDRGDWRPPANEEFAWRPFQYVNNGGDFVRNRASFAGLGQVRVFIPDGLCPACYTNGDDTIHLQADGVVDRSPDDVDHEFGHYVMDKAYGDSYNPSPGGAHALCDVIQDRALSWSEGFGDFMGPRINNEIFPTNGANGDVLYNRPWNGTVFTWNMETDSATARCNAAITGDSNEMNVAQSLWDLRDGANDGLDVSSDSMFFISQVVNNCDDFSYNDFYNGGGANAHSATCNWNTQGGSTCNFVRTASQNNINFNQAPSATVTSQGSFSWVRGNITISANASDPECGTGLLSVTFRISADNVCTAGDSNAGIASSSPFSVTFNTALIPDDASVWTCAQPNDGMADGGFAISASQIGVDNTAPTLSLTTSCATPGNAGWCRSPSATVTSSASDATSGIASTSCTRDGVGIPCGTITVTGEGTHTVSLTATDLAGNSASTTTTVKIDSVTPASSVAALPACGPSPVTLRWNGSEATSGLASFDVQSRNVTLNGAWTDLALGTTATTANFSGNSGQTYEFRSRALDVAGNLEAYPGTGDTRTTFSPCDLYATTSGTFTGGVSGAANVQGAPNNLYATLAAGDVWGGGFPAGSGNITRVEILIEYNVSRAFRNDTLTLRYTLNNGVSFGTTQTTFVPAATADTQLLLNVTGDRAWTWADITNLKVDARRVDQGGSDGTLNVDALWVRVTASPLLSESFDDGVADGFTLSGLWHVNSLCKTARSSPNQLSYHRVGLCDYDTGAANSGEARFSIDLTGRSTANLTFYHQFQVESYPSPFDVMRVQISIDGGATWTTLRQWDSRNATLAAWTEEIVNLDTYTGRAVQIRFFFDTVDSVANNFPGWYVEDVLVN